MTLYHHLGPRLILRWRLLHLQNQTRRLIRTLNPARIILPMRITDTGEEVRPTARGEGGGEGLEVQMLEEGGEDHMVRMLGGEVGEAGHEGDPEGPMLVEREDPHEAQA